MRVLVTGGAGFIGSHLVDALLARGAEVALVDHMRRSPRPWVTEALRRGARLHVADVRDLDALRGAFEAARPDVVMHLAAQVDVRRSVADPAFNAQVNVAGTVSVLEAARSAGAGRILFASTAATYGNPERVPTGEDERIAPLSPYGTSKAAAEWYLEQYAACTDLDALAADGERVRAAPGSARRGGRGRDLRRSIRGGAAGHGLRGRPPDAR